MDSFHSMMSTLLGPSPGLSSARSGSGSAAGDPSSLGRTSSSERATTSSGGHCRRASAPPHGSRSFFNPERLLEEKKQWASEQLRRETPVKTAPRSLIEAFLVVGLHPDVEKVEAAAPLAAGARAAARAASGQGASPRPGGAACSEHEPSVLFCWPPKPKVPLQGIEGFCFPFGVRPRLVERTPSLSELNEVLFGNAFLSTDENGFVFRIQDGDLANPATVWGVVYFAAGLVSSPPPMVLAAWKQAGVWPSNGAAQRPLTRHVLEAPRAYVLLSRYPFFSLHFSVLRAVLAEERLGRIRESMLPGAEEPAAQPEGASKRSGSVASSDAGASCGNLAESQSRPPGSVGESARDGLGGSARAEGQAGADLTSVSHAADEALEIVKRYAALRVPRPGERVSFCPTAASGELVFRRWAPGGGTGSDGEDELIIVPPRCDTAGGPGDEPGSPEGGGGVAEQPDAQGICRSVGTPAPGADEGRPDAGPMSLEPADGEEGFSVQVWAVVALCRSLSLPCIMQFLNAILLEKQIVVFCPNIGLLSAIVMSAVALLQPLQWRSALTPVMPERQPGVLTLLEAPVPFVVGLTQKSDEARELSAGLCRVNVYKDAVVPVAGTVRMPRQAELAEALAPLHLAFSKGPFRRGAEHRPVHDVPQEQHAPARRFCAVVRNYVASLIGNLDRHAIIDVGTRGERAAVLHLESWVEQFDEGAREFARAFAATQHFSAYSDERLRGLELRDASSVGVLFDIKL